MTRRPTDADLGIWTCRRCLAACGRHMSTCAVCNAPRNPHVSAPQPRRTAQDRPQDTPEPQVAKGAGSRNRRATAPARAPRDRTPRPANKAEAEWIAILRQRFPSATVTPHGMTLVFPEDGDRYTPDVLLAFGQSNFAVILYEVKARYRGPGWEQGMERFKRAKLAFPWAKLRLAEKRPQGWYLDGRPYTVALSGPTPAGQ